MNFVAIRMFISYPTNKMKYRDSAKIKVVIVTFPVINILTKLAHMHMQNNKLILLVGTLIAIELILICLFKF